jgi:hypothetical protein
MLAGAREPTSDCVFRGGENAGGGAEAEAFGDGMEDLGNTPGWRLQTIEWGIPAGRDLSFTGLAEEILDRLVAAVIAVADQGVDGRVGDPEVPAIRVGTGVPPGVDGFLAAAGAFALGIRDNGCRAGWSFP